MLDAESAANSAVGVFTTLVGGGELGRGRGRGRAALPDSFASGSAQVVEDAQPAVRKSHQRR